MGIYIDKKSQTVNTIQNILEILLNITDNNDFAPEFKDVIIQCQNYNWDEFLNKDVFENNSIYEIEINIKEINNIENINKLINEFQKIDLEFLFNLKPFKEFLFKILDLYFTFKSNYSSFRNNFFTFPFSTLPAITNRITHRRRNLITYTDILFPPPPPPPPDPPRYDQSPNYD